MKKFLALAVLATSTVSFAAERNIYDIMYLPNAGTGFGFTEFSYLSREIEADGGDLDVSGWGVSQTIGYSFTDRFSLNGSLNYIEGEQDPEGDSSVDISGISDPTFTGRYRAMDEGMILDVIGAVYLGLNDNEWDRDGDRDNKRGGSSLLIGAQLGKVMENFQWAVLGTYTSNSERTIELEGFPRDIDVEGGDEFLMRGDILNKLAEASLLRSHASIAFTDKEEVDGGGTLFASSTTYEIGTEYQHVCSKDLLLRAGVDYARVNAQSHIRNDDTSWNFNLGANYQF